MVTILGAGVAGLSAAIKLAQAGMKVIVLEKGKFIGKASDGIQAIRNYEHECDQIDFLEKNGIRIKHANPIYKIIKYAPSGKSMTIHAENNRPLFYSVKRGSSENSVECQLYKQAQDLGVDIVFNSAADIRASDADIIAVGGVHNNIWAYGAVYTNARMDKGTILFFMDNRYCPKGYIYAVPHGNEVTIAATTFEAGCPLPKLFEKFISENAIIKDVLRGATFVKHISGFEYCNVPKTAVINNKKVVGSAAGFIDPSRGFGIKYAILSGMAAAQSIIENKDYDEIWKSAFEKELLEGFKRRLLLEKLDNDAYEKFIADDKISIKEYNKFPVSGDALTEASCSVKLEEHRRKYDLAAFFKA